MQPVKPVTSQLYSVGIGLFLLFAALSLPFLFLAFFVVKTEPNWSYTVVLVLMGNSILWFLLAVFGKTKSRLIAKRLSRLKANGDLYEVTIKQMVPLWYIRLGAYLTASVRGHYTDRLGKIRPVQSINYVFTAFDQRDDFKAYVYVDPRNSKTYAVELLRKK